MIVEDKLQSCIYRTVYFSPDRTKFESVKYRKLVDELKQRKQNGETNLIIRNNTIIKKLPKVNSGTAEGSPTHEKRVQISKSLRNSKDFMDLDYDLTIRDKSLLSHTKP